MSGFADIIGQQRPIDVLRQAMRSGKVAHAYLFAGAPGVGKATTARVFAAALNCQSLPDDACGTCISCHKMAEGNHPDYFEIAREADKKNITIDKIREAIKQTQYRPYEGRYKVFLIDGAEQMTIEAANALLKTLEEPTAQTVFILVTPAPHQLPSTVVSRCQTLRFNAIEQTQVSQWAQMNLGMDEQDADLAAALAEGSLGRAETLDLGALRETRLALFESLVADDDPEEIRAMKLGSVLLQQCDDLRDGIELLAGFIRDAVLWQISGDEQRLRNRDVHDLITQYAGRYESKALLAKTRSLVYAWRLVERNVNKTAIAEGLSLDLITRKPTSFAAGRLPR